MARRQYTYFKFGTTTPTETVFAKIGETLKDGYNWVMEKINSGSEVAKSEAKERAQKLKEEL